MLDTSGQTSQRVAQSLVRVLTPLLGRLLDAVRLDFELRVTELTTGAVNKVELDDVAARAVLTEGFEEHAEELAVLVDTSGHRSASLRALDGGVNVVHYSTGVLGFGD